MMKQKSSLGISNRRILAGLIAVTLLPVLGIAASAGPAEAGSKQATTVGYYGANRQPINGYELIPTSRVPDVYTGNNGSTITLTLGSGATAQTCTGPVGERGYASCSLGVLWQKAGNVPMHVEYSGDSTYAATSSDSFLMVYPETTYLSLSSARSSELGAPVTLNARMSAGIYSPVALAPGQPLVFTLGSGSTAQTCAAATDSSGNASCTIAHDAQPVGATATAVAFAQNDYQYPSADSGSLSTTQVATTVALTSATAVVHGHDLVVSTNLLDDFGVPVTSGQGVVATLGNGPSCTTSGAVTCTIHNVQQAVGSVPLTLAFAGDSTYLPSSQTVTVAVTRQPTAVVSTTATTAVDGGAFTLSAILTRDTAPAVLAGLPLTLTVGSGSSAQSCTATTDQNGLAGCTLQKLTQPGGSVAVAAQFAGTATYLMSAAPSSTVYVSVPTSLTAARAAVVVTGFPLAANATTKATLLDVFGAPVAGQVVMFTSKGTGPSGTGSGEVCRATTDANGVASCAAGGATGQAVLASGYDVAFAATGFYLASAGHGAAPSQSASTQMLPQTGFGVASMLGTGLVGAGSTAVLSGRKPRGGRTL